MHFRILTALYECLHSYLPSSFMPGTHLNLTFSCLASDQAESQDPLASCFWLNGWPLNAGTTVISDGLLVLHYCFHKARRLDIFQAFTVFNQSSQTHVFAGVQLYSVLPHVVHNSRVLFVITRPLLRANRFLKKNVGGHISTYPMMTNLCIH